MSFWPGPAPAQCPHLDDPDFAPVIHLTLRTGIEAMLSAAGAWLAAAAAKP
jgi:hippurate hydrolase